jgi:hypothetical protein
MSVADDLGVNVHTLSYCMKNRISIDRSILSVSLECSSQNWTREGQLSPLINSDGLTREAIRACRREQDIYAHHLTGRKATFCAMRKDTGSGGRERRYLKDESAKLTRDVPRKNKALAEVAGVHYSSDNMIRHVRVKSPRP